MPCNQGQNNPTCFRVGLANNTGLPLESCQFELSWGDGVYDCSASLVAILNDPQQLAPAIIDTDDYLIDEATCGLATPLQPISFSGQTHWLWARLIIGGVVYERRLYFTKQ